MPDVHAANLVHFSVPREPNVPELTENSAFAVDPTYDLMQETEGA